MKETCCVKALTVMQDIKGMGSFLEFLTKASPYIILIPSLGSGVANQGIRNDATKQLVEMTIAKAVEKATAAGKLPDVNDAVKSVSELIRGQLHNLAFSHSTIHSVGTMENKFWEKLRKLYEAPSGSAPAPSTGWFW